MNKQEVVSRLSEAVKQGHDFEHAAHEVVRTGDALSEAEEREMLLDSQHLIYEIHDKLADPHCASSK